MDDRDLLTTLRSLVMTGDGPGLVALLRSEWPDHSLQLIGDGLVAAVAADVDGAAVLAEEGTRRLRERQWEGDEELAQALDAALGSGPAPMLRRLAVPLEELAGILEGDPIYGGGRIDLTTGEVWPQPAVDYGIEVDEIDEDDDDPERWLWVHCEGSREGYRDMAVFIERLDDERLAERLGRAIGGRGAFRRFRDRLYAERPDLVATWHAFSDDRRRGRARSWLAAAGYAPARP